MKSWVKAWQALLLLGLYFFSAFSYALRITYILECDDHYEIINSVLLPHPDTSGKLKKESDPVFLRVSFDGALPDSILFASGEGLSCVNSVNPSNVHQTGMVRRNNFEQDYLHVLARNGFAFDDIDYFALLRRMEKSDIDHDLNDIRTQAVTLETEYNQRCAFLSETEAPDMKSQIEHLGCMGKLQTQYCEYLVHMVRAGTPLSNWLSIKDYCDRVYGSDKSDEKVNHIHASIDREFQKRKDVLTEVSRILPQAVVTATAPAIESAPMVERDSEAHLKLFIQNWGKHAEDALILQILDNVRKFGKIPKKIEIYGTKDPCFHCQMKLQWLADLLRGKIERAEMNQFIKVTEPSPETEICYYSKKDFESECVMMQVPTTQKSRRYTTRTLNELNKIKVFNFTSNKAPDEKEMECFNIYTIDLSHDGPNFDLAHVITNAKTYIKIELINFNDTQPYQDKMKHYLQEIEALAGSNLARITVGVFITDKTGRMVNMLELPKK